MNVTDFKMKVTPGQMDIVKRVLDINAYDYRNPIYRDPEKRTKSSGFNGIAIWGGTDVFLYFEKTQYEACPSPELSFTEFCSMYIYPMFPVSFFVRIGDEEVGSPAHQMFCDFYKEFSGLNIRDTQYVYGFMNRIPHTYYNRKISNKEIESHSEGKVMSLGEWSDIWLTRKYPEIFKVQITHENFKAFNERYEFKSYHIGDYFIIDDTFSITNAMHIGNGIDKLVIEYHGIKADSIRTLSEYMFNEYLENKKNTKVVSKHESTMTYTVSLNDLYKLYAHKDCCDYWKKEIMKLIERSFSISSYIVSEHRVPVNGSMVEKAFDVAKEKEILSLLSEVFPDFRSDKFAFVNKYELHRPIKGMNIYNVLRNIELLLLELFGSVYKFTILNRDNATCEENIGRGFYVHKDIDVVTNVTRDGGTEIIFYKK